MAPIAVEDPPVSNVRHVKNGLKTSTPPLITRPIPYSGSLDEYESFNVTNVIGKEFPKLQISDILHDDAKIRDLAVLGEFQRVVIPGCVALG